MASSDSTPPSGAAHSVPPPALSRLDQNSQRKPVGTNGEFQKLLVRIDGRDTDLPDRLREYHPAASRGPQESPAKASSRAYNASFGDNPLCDKKSIPLLEDNAALHPRDSFRHLPDLAGQCISRRL